MIKVFKSTDKYFASNGDKIIKPYKAVVYKEDNGDYYCDIEAQIDLLEWLKQDMIVCVQTPWGWQPFRCDKPTKSGNKVTVRAWHLYYDTENYVITEKSIVGQGCQAALNQLKGSCDATLPFSVVSDIVTQNDYSCVRKNFAEAVNDVLEIWGGHLDRDGFNIGIKTTIGQDRGVTLSYGKNIKEITAEENWDNVCTKILPVGKNDITIEFLTSETQYDIPYTKVIEFDQTIEQADGESDEDYTSRLKADLLTQATAYLIEHALPEINYTLKAHLQDVADVGDTIWVKHPRCQVDVETHVISVKWDAIKGEYKEIEFGNFRKKLSGLNSVMTAEIKKAEKTTESFVNEELRKATDKIMGVFGNSYVIYDGDKILIVDKLPKEEAKNVIRINSAGIGFSNTGINGTFNSAWLIDGTFDAQQINVINLNADAITSGTIDASKINVINLDADSITSGTIDADRIGAGTFHITGGSFQIANAVQDYSYIRLSCNWNSEVYTIELNASGLICSSSSGAATRILPDSIQIMEDNVVIGSFYYNDTLKRSGLAVGDITVDEIEADSIKEAGQALSKIYASKTHTHSRYYESGDNIHANYLYIASVGSASVQALYRSTNSGIVGTDSSSERYKNSIAEVTDEMLDPHRLYDLPVRQFKWNEGHFDESENYNYDTLNIGFIAEEVAEFYPYATVLSKDKEIESWEVRRILPGMLALIQDQKKMIDNLTDRVNELEGVK